MAWITNESDDLVQLSDNTTEPAGITPADVGFWTRNSDEYEYNRTAGGLGINTSRLRVQGEPIMAGMMRSNTVLHGRTGSITVDELICLKDIEIDALKVELASIKTELSQVLERLNNLEQFSKI